MILGGWVFLMCEVALEEVGGVEPSSADTLLGAPEVLAVRVDLPTRWGSCGNTYNL